MENVLRCRAAGVERPDKWLGRGQRLPGRVAAARRFGASTGDDLSTDRFRRVTTAGASIDAKVFLIRAQGASG
jgi:hypothetical protein